MLMPSGPGSAQPLNANNVQPSTWFMRDGSFVRLKQVEIDTPASQLSEKIAHQSVQAVCEWDQPAAVQ